MAVLSISTPLTTRPAIAVAPIDTSVDTEGRVVQLRRQLLRPVKPFVGRLLRQPLSQDFAVLLLRSSYNACDTLDVIPMAQFQRDFFLIRSAEYQFYLQASGAGASAMVRQGDVTDPNYFDTLSLAQYKTIARSVAQPVASVFTEEQPIQEDAVATSASSAANTDTTTTAQRFQPVMVRRIWSDKELVPLFDRLVGESILQWINDTYGATPIALPLLSQRASAEIDTVLYQGLEQLVKLFCLNGFAWDGRVERVVTNTNRPSTLSCRLILTSPATAYASRILAAEDARSGITNDFLGKTAKAWIASTDTGLAVSQYKVELPSAADGSEITYLTITTAEQ